MFQQIESNKRMSALLVLAVTALLVALGWVLGLQFGGRWEVGVGAALVVALVSGCLSYYSGGQIVLALSGAHKIEKADSPQLFNVVEEMCIAAGLPMPDIYIIEDSAPNAFATGRKPEEAVIAVTRGLLEKLNRDELQGVVAHEMSHIRNYDVLFMTMMAVLVGTIALLSDAFLRGTRYGIGGARGRGSGAGVIFLLALALALLAPIAGKLIQLAASRRREYLADASAALLTRYPAGLASALRKLAADPSVLEAANRATQHMYIVNPVRGMDQLGDSVWNTHPPILERIKRLDRMAYMEATDEARFPRPVAAAAAQQPAALAATAPVAAAVAGPVAAPAALAVAGVAAGAPAAPASAVPADAGACPRCSERLARGKIKGRGLRVCRACGGVWIGQNELTDLLRTAPQGLVAADARFPNLVGLGWNRMAPKRCPECGESLILVGIEGAPEVVVDRCPKCQGVWFDDGELAAVASAAKSQQASAAQ